MSQYITSAPGYPRILYGFDNALGYWMDFYSEDDFDTPSIEESSIFTGLSNGRFLDLLNEMKVQIPLEHYHSIALDLEF